MNEHTYIDSISRHIIDPHQWKINDMYATGVPDSFYEGSERDLWVEYKHIKPFPKKPTTLIDLTNPKYYLSKKQQLWITRRHSIRKDAWVIVGSEHGGVIFRDLGWQKPFSASEFLERVMPAKLIAAEIMAFIDGRA